MHAGRELALFTLTMAAALGSGVVCGILFAFSNFVMKALARLRPEHAIAAMQAINVTVINPLFLLVFVGTAALCLTLLAATLWFNEPSARIALASAAYLLGCIAVTRLGNIPLNDALDRITPDAPEAAEFWARYRRRWLRFNHVRTLASLLAALLFTLALAERG